MKRNDNFFADITAGIGLAILLAVFLAYLVILGW